MDLNRRQFLGCLPALAVMPVIPNDCQAKPWKPEDFPLVFRFVPVPGSSFCQQGMFEISKGPYKALMGLSAGQDLRDCHGLCATDELSYILVQQLEYDSETLRKLYDELPVIKTEQLQGILNQKRVNLTKAEKLIIHGFVTSLRGEHECAHNGYKRSNGLHEPYWLR